MQEHFQVLMIMIHDLEGENFNKNEVSKIIKNVAKERTPFRLLSNEQRDKFYSQQKTQGIVHHGF